MLYLLGYFCHVYQDTAKYLVLCAIQANYTVNQTMNTITSTIVKILVSLVLILEIY